MFKIIIIFCFVLTNVFGFYHDFDVIFKESEKALKQNKGFVLIFGGIQGDEPGGFHAAALLADEYSFDSKVMIVPNLAYESILLRGRGMYGDLNRKFAELDKKDPDYQRVQKIKNLILRDDIDFIINLHDGSGFYAKTKINQNQNPDKWGNACIIDQTKIDTNNGDLYALALRAQENINKNLIKPHHYYHIKNTNTKDGDEQMLKALTYFAITHGKAAVANEASKDLPTHERVYYHLLAIEGYLDALGIKYKRDFALTPLNVYHKINKDFLVNMQDLMVFPINNLRARLNYIPFDEKYLKNSFVDIQTKSPLIAVYKQNNTPKDTLLLQYGNRLKTTFKTFNIKYADKFSAFDMVIDGQKIKIDKAGIYKVKNNFMILPQDGLRFNVIGFVKQGTNDESGVVINAKNIQKRFSIDKKGKIFRLEVYKKTQTAEEFAGMILLKF